MFQSDYRLEGKYEFVGEWWAPQSPELRLPGILKFSPSAIGLTLFRSSDWTSASDFPGGVYGAWETVHGVTGSGMELTLWNVVNFEGDVAVTAEAQLVVIGGHFTDRQSEQFVSCAMTSPRLAAFQRFKYVEYGSEFLTADDDSRFALRSVERPHERWLVERAAFHFGLFHQVSQSGGFNSASIDVKEWAYVHSEVPRAFDWCIQTLHHFSSLLTLLTAERDRFAHVTVNARESRFPCSVLFRMRQEGSETSGDVDLQGILALPLFKREDCPHFERVLDVWFSMSNTMRSAVDLAVDALQTDNRTLEASFLSAVKSVEVISRALQSGEYLSHSTFEAFLSHMVSAVPNGLPDDFAASFKSRLRFANELSLKRRIDGLLECLPSSLQELVCLKRSRFARGVTGTRNYLTHFTEELRETALEGNELYWATQKLLQLSRIHLLRFVGVTDDQIVQRLTAHPSLGMLRRNFQGVREEVEH